MKSKIKIFLMTILIATMILASPINRVEAANSLKLIVEGEDITSIAMPVIENSRTLVPIRFVSEHLGSEVSWDNDTRTVLIEDTNKSILLKINSKLINYDGGKDYALSDVEPKLLNKDGIGNSRTYVPLRLVSDALDIGVEWNENERTVYIDSNRPVEKFENSIEIISQDKNEVISGETTLQVKRSREYPKGSHIKFLLIDQGDTEGFILAKSNNIDGIFKYSPKIEDNGKKALVASIYNQNGILIDGHAMAIEVKLDPKVELAGVDEGQVVATTVDLSANTNFTPLYVKYEMEKINSSSGEDVKLTSVKDPLGAFNWNPMMKENGLYSVRVLAYDTKGKAYYSEAKKIEVNKDRVLTLNGVKENMKIDKSVTLSANRNFDVSETSYMVKDLDTGVVSTLVNIPYGSYTWNPGPDESGIKELFVRVVDRGVTYESEPVRVSVDGEPKIMLEGIKPNQIIGKAAILNYESNVDVDKVEYIITNSSTNKEIYIEPEAGNSEAIYAPLKNEKGERIIEVRGEYRGQIISSEKIKFKVYNGELFSPQPIVKKDEFISLASKLAAKSYKDTGMSAALQTAQAILETGWGQSVPVDKYTGLKSNNLFGIKGRGTKGSVVSNTWEVYNGETYRVDADFRAYENLDESWKDHKTFLINGERYKDFTEVMYDYTKGAWALKRAGYATDPEYPIKLINLIIKYNLDDLDKIKI